MSILQIHFFVSHIYISGWLPQWTKSRKNKSWNPFARCRVLHALLCFWHWLGSMAGPCGRLLGISWRVWRAMGVVFGFIWLVFGRSSNNWCCACNHAMKGMATTQASLERGSNTARCLFVCMFFAASVSRSQIARFPLCCYSLNRIKTWGKKNEEM